jgi:enamine deaminase RidA (YjgF/YER057c/UK114 family)
VQITRIRPAELFGEVPYAYASVTEPGALIFTAGACPLGEDGRIVAPGDYEQQARKALDNLFAVLAAAGSSPSEVLKSTVYVASDRREHLLQAWNVVRAGFGGSDPPSTLLGVSVLGWPDQLVEIEAVAAVNRATE